jgi:hypothetical protein
MLTRYLAAAAAGTLVLSLASTAGAEDPGPINAGNTYKWGHIAQNYGWEHHTLYGHWAKSGTGRMQFRNGMLTLEPRVGKSYATTLKGKGHAWGRWEVRARERVYGSGEPYTMLTQLVPAHSAQRACGTRNIDFGVTTGLRSHVDLAIHHGTSKYVATKAIKIRDGHFHTYAVEVTKNRISWFIDAHVVTTEKRKIAPGVPLTVRFAMVPPKHGRAQNTWLQYDWLRYWTLQRPDAKSVAARPDAVESEPGC